MRLCSLTNYCAGQGWLTRVEEMVDRGTRGRGAGGMAAGGGWEPGAP